MKKLIFIVWMLLCGAAQAQPYIGGSVGYGFNGVNDEARYASPTFHITQKTHDAAGSLFVGYRFKRSAFAVEAGAIRLPTYYANMYTSNYTAYLGKDVGITTAYATDEVSGKSVYLRGNYYLTRGPLQPYVAAGMARTQTLQDTRGWYDQGTSNATYGPAHYDKSNTKPLYAVGVQYSVDGVFARIEYVRISQAIETPAIGKRDIGMLMLGVGFSF